MFMTVALKDSPVEFSLIQDPKIRFRPLRACDIPLMHLWLNRAFVSRWFGGGFRTYEQVLARYGPRIRREILIDPYFLWNLLIPVNVIETEWRETFRERFIKIGSETVGIPSR